MTNAQILIALARKFGDTLPLTLDINSHPSCFQTLEGRLSESADPSFWWKPELLETAEEILQQGHLFEVYFLNYQPSGNAMRVHNMVAGNLTTLLRACKERLLTDTDCAEVPDVLNFDATLSNLITACKGGVCIHANNHRTMVHGTEWNTLEEFVTDGHGMTDADEVVDREAILASKTIWEVQFYGTATGFRCTYASTLDGVMAATATNEL